MSDSFVAPLEETVETLNGEAISTGSLTNRAFLYGDGVFTTLKLSHGEPLNIQLHWQRLRSDSRKLKIITPSLEFFNYCLNKTLPLWTKHDGIIRITVLRDGGRGYRGLSNQDGLVHIAIQELKPFPTILRLHLVNYRLSRNEITAGIKHLNRLEQVLAASELNDEFDEAVVLDTKDNVIEGIMSNIFWFKDDTFYTPEVSFAGVNGLTRRSLIQGLQNNNKRLTIDSFVVNDLLKADTIWMCNAVRGILQVSSIDSDKFQLDIKTTNFLESLIRE